jgi:CBS domain-containing protein
MPRRYEDDPPAEDFAPRRPRRRTRSRLLCRDIMTRELITAAPGATIAAVALLMRDEDTGIIPIVEKQGKDAKLLGVVTDRDIVVRVIAAGLDAAILTAGEVMSQQLHTAQPGDRVIEVIRKMGDKQVRRIPVTDEAGFLRGIISMADIALETEVDRELAEALEDISSGASFWKKLY